MEGENVKRKVIILPLRLPIDCYLYDVQLLTSVDGGNNYCYAGFGSFAKNEEEAQKIKKELEEKNHII